MNVQVGLRLLLRLLLVLITITNKPLHVNNDLIFIYHIVTIPHCDNHIVTIFMNNLTAVLGIIF